MQRRKRVYCRLHKQVTLISWEAEHTKQQIGQALYAACYIRVTRWLVTCLQSSPIGTNFAGFCSNLKQFYWCKRGGLFTGCTLIGRLQVTQWGWGIPPFHGKPKPKSWPPASPGPQPAPAPAAPHNKTFFLSFKNQQEKYQTHEL